jgi:phage terminase small subunit
MTRKIAKNTIKKYNRIIDEWFINGFNGAQAYKKFNPNVKKEDTASVNFNKLQKLSEVNAYILAKHKEAEKIIDATHEGILQELKNWVQFDITETICLSAEELKSLPVQFRRLITKYKTRLKHFYDKDGNLLNTEETIELHFVSKERAMDMINKHIGFYEKDNSQKTNEIHIHTGKEEHKTLIETIIQGQ